MNRIACLPTGIALLDMQGRITSADLRVREWLGLMESDHADAGESSIVCSERCSDLCRDLRTHALLAGDQSFVKRFDIDESLVLDVRCERRPDAPGFVLMVENATTRRAFERLNRARALQDANARLEELLAERSRELSYNREFLRSLIETNRDLVLSVSADEVITFTNTGFVGSAAGTLVGRPLADLVEAQHRDAFVRQYRDVLSGRIAHSLFEAPGIQALDDRWCLFSVGPVRSGGTVSGLTAIVSDLTALHDASERLRSNEKLVATGRMAARIAHEINNPLTGISGAMMLIKADLPADSPAGRYTEMVEREISRISNVVRQMYGLYRPEHERSRIVDLRPLLDEIITLMRLDAAQKDVHLSSLVVAPAMARVQEQNLRQILMNIIRNAVEVTTPGGVVELSVERHARCVDVIVADQGPGITDELRQQMFEPFFTTKSTSGGRGLGLGLSISDTLVKAMGGSIVFENGSAGGARCKICLPEAGVGNGATDTLDQ